MLMGQYNLEEQPVCSATWLLDLGVIRFSGPGGAVYTGIDEFEWWRCA